ncbi:SPARC-like [Pomacea canaliculata]|nr:SPARC-like [Pomacea canaliculata]
MKEWLLVLLLLGLAFSDARTALEADKADDTANGGEDYSEERVDVARVENSEERTNPCSDKECKRGEICILDSKLTPKCVCIPTCVTPDPSDDRFQVCSKRNITYHSECALDRDHCLCRRQQKGCSIPGATKIRLDYYGPCQQLTPCYERELKEFPVRMREWLYVIMQQLAQRAEIPDYLELLEEARHEANHSHAVIWKFCDLDVDPQDRFVTRRELQYTIQSLKAMEHCLLPFLDKCDIDSDSQITLWEWGRCLGIDEAKIIDECKAIRRAAKRQED